MLVVETSDSTAVYSAYWRETYKEDNVAATVINRQGETLPNLKNYHFEDIDKNVIKKDEIKVDDIIYLVVNSENAIGENVTINLDDNFKDYEYNGNPIANDILKDILITDDICKIKLKAITQQN